MIRSFDARDFSPSQLVAAKAGRRVSVCLPARNEEMTIAPLVATIRTELQERDPLVDELVVVDDGSTDATAAVAAEAGARVVTAGEILPDYGTEHGKGQAMWRGVHASTGDVIAYLDADVRSFDAGFVVGLVGPLLLDDDVEFVKGFYHRPFEGRDGEGGRVTELTARPLIALLFPELAGLVQPLAGECAGRREILESVPFVGGYGVDLGLLIDIAALRGAGAIAQSDLGRRVHRNRPLAELGAQALAILQLGLQRAGLADDAALKSTLLRPQADAVTIEFSERPPLREVTAHRHRGREPA